MTEWRREFRSWPKEAPQTADTASLPAWVVEAGRERSEAPKVKRAARRWNAFFGFVVVPYLLVAAILPSSPLTWGMILAGFAIALVAGWRTIRSLDRAASLRRDQTLERAALVGEPTLGAEFVGVDYADAAWTYSGLGTGVDEGLLCLEMDRLVFAGRETRFELPADAVLGTELRRWETGLGSRVRLVLRWAHGGKAGTVGLHLPLGRSLRVRVQDARDLRDRIERWRGEPFPRRTAPAVLPPSMTPTKRVNPLLQVGLPAKAIAAALLFASLIGLFAVIEFASLLVGYHGAARHLGGSVGALYVPGLALWLALAAKIEPRLPERYRCRAEEPTDVRDALRDVVAKPEGKRLNDDIKVR